MIAFIDGILREKYDGNIVLDVAGIGYEIMVTNSVYVNLCSEGERIKVYTYMQVKEDGISLFGFSNMEEKRLFMQLLSVSGVGAKTAIQILSSIKFNDLISSILEENTRFLSSVKGLGKKTAERIVLELKDKVNALDYIIPLEMKQELPKDENVLTEAVTVLTSLGLSKMQATNLAKSVYSDGDSVEDLVSKSLKNMNTVI